MFLILSNHAYSCLCPIHWSQMLSREWRCSWSKADNFITYIKVRIILEVWQYPFLLRHTPHEDWRRLVAEKNIENSALYRIRLYPCPTHLYGGGEHFLSIFVNAETWIFMKFTLNVGDDLYLQHPDLISAAILILVGIVLSVVVKHIDGRWHTYASVMWVFFLSNTSALLGVKPLLNLSQC